MKVSVSLPEEDVEFLDVYARDHGIPSRSAVLHQAVRSLRANQLTGAYEDAWRDWAADGDAEVWEGTTGDGISGSAPR